MISVICDSYKFEDHEEPNTRYVTYQYKTNNENDKRVMKLIRELLNHEQKRCDNCIHYQSDGYFCGYESHSCKIHGNLEDCSHPHHDGDGSKCEDYKRKE